MMTKRQLTGISLLLGCLCWLSVAQAAPKIEQWTTKNGLRVYFVQAPEVPMLDMRLVFDAGNARDGNKPGLAMLTSDMLDKGASGLSEDQLAEQFEAVGANVGASASKDMAVVSLRTLTLPSVQQTAVDLWLKVLQSPDFPSKEFEREQKLTLIGLQAEKQDPESIASKAFFQAVYGNHPYGQPANGTEASIPALQVADLKAFYQQYYVANNGLLAMVGAIDRAQAESLAERIAAVLPAGQAAPA